MKPTTMTTWRCANGHVLGQVKQNNGTRKQLVLYRQAVDMEIEQPESVDVIGVLDGTVMDIRCSICGCMRTWFFSRKNG